MPIYAYKCSACSFAKDALQKMSDAPLTVCPACGASTFEKQVTAAGFQLKGSGWYVTDFREGGSGKKPAESSTSKDAGDTAKPAASPSSSSEPAAAGGGATAAAPAPSASPAPSPAPAPPAKSD